MSTLPGGPGALWGSGGSGSTTNPPAGTTLISRLIYAALRRARVVLAPGRTPSNDQYAELLDEVNRMIGTWNCERPRIYTTTISDPLPLDGSKTYTIGIDPAGQATADFSIARPQEIVKANLLFPSEPTVRRDIHLLTDQEWGNIVVQDIPNAPMFSLYNDGGYPFSTLYCWPQSPAGYSLELFYWQAIPKFTSLDDAVTLPDGYEDAIVLNLAVRADQMAWPVKEPMNPSVRQDALRALAAIASKNAAPPPKVSSCAPSGYSGSRRGDFNWLSGTRG